MPVRHRVAAAAGAFVIRSPCTIGIAIPPAQAIGGAHNADTAKQASRTGLKVVLWSLMTDSVCYCFALKADRFADPRFATRPPLSRHIIG